MGSGACCCQGLLGITCDILLHPSVEHRIKYLALGCKDEAVGWESLEPNRTMSAGGG